MDASIYELRGRGTASLADMQEAIASLEKEVDADTTRPLICLLSTFRFFSRTLHLIQHLIHSYRFVVLDGKQASLTDLMRVAPDLCWVCYPYKEGQLALDAQQVLGIPYVLTARGEYWHMPNVAHRAHADEVVLKAAHVITLSSTFLQQLTRRLPAVSTQSFTRVPNGVTVLGNPDADDASLDALVNLPHPFITTVTNFMFEEKRRAVQELADAFDAAAWPGTFLIASKSGPFNLPFGRIGAHSYHLGFVPNIYQLLETSSVFVYHSYFDSQPSALMEALAVGVACVVVKDDHSGAHEFLVGDKTGCICESAQECVVTALELLEDPAKAKQLGRAACRAVHTNYTWENAARGHAAVFQAASAMRVRLPLDRPWEIWSERRARLYARDYGSPQNPRRDRKICMLLAAGLLRGKTVLDVGCGIGHLYPYLHVDDYLGIDNSKAMLEHARTFFPEANFTFGDIYDLTPFAIYDTVYCQSVLLHLPNITTPLAQLWAHTRHALIFSVVIDTVHTVIKEPRENDRYLICRKDTWQSLYAFIKTLPGAVLQDKIELENGNMYIRLTRESS